MPTKVFVLASQDIEFAEVLLRMGLKKEAYCLRHISEMDKQATYLQA